MISPRTPSTTTHCRGCGTLFTTVGSFSEVETLCPQWVQNRAVPEPCGFPHCAQNGIGILIDPFYRRLTTQREPVCAEHLVIRPARPHPLCRRMFTRDVAVRGTALL